MTRKKFKRSKQPILNQIWLKLLVIAICWFTGLSVTFRQHIEQGLIAMSSSHPNKEIETAVFGPFSDALSNDNTFVQKTFAKTKN